ncbi:MAG: Deacetylases, including yeast histone deacetylase and acetoin utilization protein, partial [uncultured Ramlibacter sp.]
GLLLLQQRRRRRALCAAPSRPQAGGDRRFRRPPRQRDRGHPGRRQGRADGRLLPASVLPVQRRRPACGQHGQPAGAGLHARHGDPRTGRAGMDAAAGGLPARADLHQRRLRCAPRGRARPARADRERLRLDHRPHQGRGAPPCQGPHRLRAGGRLPPGRAGAQRRGAPARAGRPV